MVISVSIPFGDKPHLGNDGYKVVASQLASLRLAPEDVKRVIDAYENYILHCSFWCYCQALGYAVTFEEDGSVGQETEIDINGNPIMTSIYRCNRCGKKHRPLMG